MKLLSFEDCSSGKLSNLPKNGNLPIEAKGYRQSCSVSKETIDLTVTRRMLGPTICSKMPILLNFVRPKRPSVDFYVSCFLT